VAVAVQPRNAGRCAVQTCPSRGEPDETLAPRFDVADSILGLCFAVPPAMAQAGDNATVSFGQWRTEPPLDRFPNLSPRLSNNHQLLPFDVTIQAGVAINMHR